MKGKIPKPKRCNCECYFCEKRIQKVNPKIYYQRRQYKKQQQQLLKENLQDHSNNQNQQNNTIPDNENNSNQQLQNNQQDHDKCKIDINQLEKIVISRPNLEQNNIQTIPTQANGSCCLIAILKTLGIDETLHPQLRELIHNIIQNNKQFIYLFIFNVYNIFYLLY
jgi:hypothetical protein